MRDIDDRIKASIIVIFSFLLSFFLYDYLFSTNLNTVSFNFPFSLSEILKSSLGKSVSIYATPAQVKQELGMDGFARCLTNKGVKMYGTDTCPSCASQRELFQESFKYITYIDCGKSQSLCKTKNIRGYPTWELNDGKMLSGVIPIEYMVQETGCIIN